MKAARGRPLLERLVALCIGAVLAFQPAARAGTPCPTRGSNAERACCCGPSSQAACCASEVPSREHSPVVRRDRCGCELRAPAPSAPLPNSVDPRGPRAGDAASTSDWIADGARASAGTWIPAFVFGPDPPGLAPPDPLCPRFDQVRAFVVPAAAHGIHALLAALGSLLR